jgi:hypothetical protein
LGGNFCVFTSLHKPQNLTEGLLKIGDVLIPNSIERLIHKDFCFDFKFENFNRKDFSNSVKTKLDEMQASTCVYYPETINKEDYKALSFEQNQTLNSNFFESLLNYCKLDSATNSKANQHH